MPAWSLDKVTNIGHSLTETASQMPSAIAVACPAKGQPKSLVSGSKYKYDQITFGELERRSNQIANGIGQMGIEAGTRLALMVPPGIDFVANVFGLFKAGVIVILIDPGMGKKNMIQCLSDAKPKGLVGIRKAQLARNLYRRKLAGCKKNIAVGGFFPGCRNQAHFYKLSDKFESKNIQREDPAAIIFTTGSTGPPKGVLYRHRVFIEQCEQIRDYFQIEPGTIDVSGFPLFALFNTAMGATTVFPEMDPTRPADVHPPNIIDAVTQFNADQSFGSPALWNTVSKYCEKHSFKLPTIKRILSAGAPVPASVLGRMKGIIAEDGDAFTPYGATEALPVACNSATVVMNETGARTDEGGGVCVGNRFPKMDWRVIKISDEPIGSIDDVEDVPQSEVGELMVKGPTVTRHYVTRSEANADHKVADGEAVWHRMGDLGYLDEQDRFWFCGRKSHRVTADHGTMFTVPCEAIINTHAQIYRSALIGIGEKGNQESALVVEPLAECWPDTMELKQKLIDEVRELCNENWQTNKINHIFLKEALPVDIRHNSKIFREQLREWAKPLISK